MQLQECSWEVQQTEDKTVVSIWLPDDEAEPHFRHECSPANAALVEDLKSQVVYLRGETAFLRTQLAEAQNKLA